MSGLYCRPVLLGCIAGHALYAVLYHPVHLSGGCRVWQQGCCIPCPLGTQGCVQSNLLCDIKGNGRLDTRDWALDVKAHDLQVQQTSSLRSIVRSLSPAHAARRRLHTLFPLTPAATRFWLLTTSSTTLSEKSSVCGGQQASHVRHERCSLIRDVVIVPFLSCIYSML
jgi:hypothetical protein